MVKYLRAKRPGHKGRPRFGKSRGNHSIVGSATQAGKPIKFAKDSVPYDVIKELVKPLKSQVGPATEWISAYYVAIVEGKKNGNTIKKNAPEPEADGANDNKNLLAYQRLCTRYDNRRAAAKVLVNAMMDALSEETFKTLKLLSPAMLGLPEGTRDFESYIASTQMNESDPVLVYHMICKAVMKENMGPRFSLEYAQDTFNELTMRETETVQEFKKRYLNTQQSLKMFLYRKKSRYPWVEMTEKGECIDMSVACFLAKLTDKDYRRDASKGYSARRNLQTDGMPESIDQAALEAENNRLGYNDSKNRSQGKNQDRSNRNRPIRAPTPNMTQLRCNQDPRSLIKQQIPR